jgi:hypothetical protein
MTIGPMICGIGLLLLVGLNPDSNIWTGVLPAVTVLGIGLAGTVAPLTDTVMSSVPDKHSGVAAAFNNAVSRIAALIAIAGLGVVLTATFTVALETQTENLSLDPSEAATLETISQDLSGTQEATQLPPEAQTAVDESYTVALHWVIVVTAVMAFVGGLVAVMMIRDPAPERAKSAVTQEDIKSLSSSG